MKIFSIDQIDKEIVNINYIGRLNLYLLKEIISKKYNKGFSIIEDTLYFDCTIPTNIKLKLK